MNLREARELAQRVSDRRQEARRALAVREAAEQSPIVYGWQTPALADAAEAAWHASWDTWPDDGRDMDAAIREAWMAVAAAVEDAVREAMTEADA